MGAVTVPSESVTLIVGAAVTVMPLDGGWVEPFAIGGGSGGVCE